MKLLAIFYIGLLGMFWVGCEYQSPPKEKTYGEIVENELKSGVRNDTIFLNFRLGMPKAEAEKKFRDLIKSGVIGNRELKFVDAVNMYGPVTMRLEGYSYNFNTAKKSFKSIIEDYYFRDSLSGLSITFCDDFYLDPDSTYEELNYMYKEKYGNFILKKVSDTLGLKTVTSYWIDGNREISLTAVRRTTCFIKYNDIPLTMRRREFFKQIETEIDSMDTIEKNEKAQETQRDI